jgi:CRP-like cAMP-binding protein
MTSVPLLRLDPDLGAAIPEPGREAALHECRARVLEIPRGEWLPPGDPVIRSGFGLLVLDGVLCRRVVQGERFGAELIGAGDLMRPWDQIGGWASIRTESSWTVIEAARVAILDAAFARHAAPFPEIGVALLRRGLLRSRYLAILVAIISQRRVEARLTMLFWHLADRFGQMRGKWIEIPVPLTHSVLGELIAARRPSVTTALSKLQERGVLARERGGWRLRGTLPPEYAAPRRPDARTSPL